MFKDQLIKTFSKWPNFLQYQADYHRRYYGKFNQPYKDILIHRLENIIQKDILHHHVEKGNPLPTIIDKMKISYKTGGFFRIKRVKAGQIYGDFDILIDQIENKDVLKRLYQLHE